MNNKKFICPNNRTSLIVRPWSAICQSTQKYVAPSRVFSISPKKINTETKTNNASLAMSGNTRFHINLKIMQTESVRRLVLCLGELKLLRPTKEYLMWLVIREWSLFI